MCKETTVTAPPAPSLTEHSVPENVLDAPLWDPDYAVFIKHLWLKTPGREQTYDMFQLVRRITPRFGYYGVYSKARSPRRREVKELTVARMAA